MSTFTFVLLHKDNTSEKHNVDIYLDDTIENIKTKLSAKLDVKNIQHYYLFYKDTIPYDPYEVYKKLSLDGERTITSNIYDIFCLNHNLPLSKEKDNVYELDDFLKLELKELETTIPIGISRKTTFVVNPFQNNYNQIEDSSTTSKELLMEYTNIDGKEIFVCLAQEVMEYCLDNKLETKQVINVYYPYLFQQNQIEVSLLKPNESVSDKYKDYNEMIDFLHSKYKPELKPEQGISDIYFVSYALCPIDFPIHVFFKLIQTSIKTPFIKLNGKRKSEHMYRLYCKYLSDKGNRVPSLSKKELIRHGVPLKNPNHLCYFFQEKNLIMEIDQTGNIFFKLHDMKITTMDEVEKIIRETSNEIIDKLLEYFDPSNKIFSHFKSFQDKNIEIIEITYKFLYKKEKKLDLKRYMPCFSCVLNYIDDKNSITKLRYKRVSDFNVTESMDAYLIEAVNKQLTNSEIGYGTEEEIKEKFTRIGQDDVVGDESIRSLIYNFAVNFKNNNIEEATEYISKFFENLQLNQEIGRNRIRKVKTNPGFLIEIKEIDKYYEAKVLSIDNIKYVPFIELFLSVLVLMSQGLITDDGKCFKKVSEVTIDEVINVAPIEEIIEEDNDFDIEMNEEDIFNFNMNEEPKEKEKEEEVDLDEISPVEEPNELAEISPVEEAKEKEKEEVDLDEISQVEEEPNELAEISPVEEESNELAAISSDEESSVEMMGGSFKYNSSGNYLVFIYDNNDPATVLKRYGNDLRIDEAKLIDYFRAFDDDKCTIIPKKDTSVKGYSIRLTSEQFKNFIEINEGTTPIEVDIYDKAGNKLKGVSYKRDIDTLYNEPGLTYLKRVYATVEIGWKKKHMDEPGIIYIYDKKYELRGEFNNITFIKKGEKIKIDLDSKNPFLKRMQERQPILFPQEDDKEFKYSRACQWSDRRTPVILTKEEKDEIDEIAPGAYDSVLEYSTDPDQPYYYICPRYWDLKHMRPVKQEDVDKSKLIPKDATTKMIKQNIQSKYILEFSKDGEFHTRIGFLTKNKRADGYHLPCCFKQKEKKETKKGENVVGRVTTEALTFYQESKRKFEESKKEKEKNPEEKVAETKKEPIKLIPVKKTETVKYIENILNGDKFPLEEFRRGHLTPILERFFNFNSTQCYSNPIKRKIKLNTPCLLRRGVEHSQNQSFLAAMAFVMNSKNTSIEEFKTKILNVINIDNIQTFHGGNIVHTFSKPDYEKQNISKYTNSNLYKKFRGNELAFKKIVNGYENFREYILSDEFIDYTYLWDIMCSGLLYKSRINLVILHEDMQDPTHNLTIVCPTTTHSDYRFNPKLPSCILYRYDNYFEPIFSYMESEKEYSETKFFSVDTQIPILSKILKQIDNHIGELCRETAVNKRYMFKMNIYLDKLITEIQKLDGYSIDKQIMNFDGRIIGVMVNKDKTSFFVPCRASQVTGDYELITDNLWNDYNTTLTCLEKLFKDSNGSIPCKPKMKMVEESMIIGILTETNQMVPLMEPEQNVKNDSLIEVDEHSYVVYDQYIAEHPLKNEKAKVIKNLKLEQSFYNAFFNIIKIKVNDLNNLSLKLKIQDIIKKEDTFDNKFANIKELITPLVEERFDFIEYDQKILDEIDDINLCKSKEQPYCSFETDDGKLLIPIKNLFNRLNNKELYTNRFIDDIISNFYIQQQFLNETHSTIFYTDKFNLTEKEILLLESAIPFYYDENSVIVKNIPSIQHRSIEDVQPNEILDGLETIPISESTLEEIPETKINIPQTQKVESDDIIEEVYSSDEEETDLHKIKTPMKKLLPKIQEETKEEETVIKEPTIEEPTIKEPVVQEIEKTIKLVKRLVIHTPSKKKKADIVEASEKITTAVKKAEELVKKENSPKHQELLAETKEVMDQVKEIERAPLVPAPQKIPLKIVATKGLHESLVDPNWKECIEGVAYLTEKWKQYFQKGTKDFRIGIGKTYNEKEQNPLCNMYMALNILKDYNQEIYHDYKIKDLKALLIKMYNDYNKFRQLILVKWKDEKDKDYHMTKETTIENIILNEGYQFTEVDMVLMTFYYNLPIVFFHQGKDKIKMLRRENHTEDYAYYIKMKGSSIFMLFWQHKKTFKIYDSDIKPEHKKDLFDTRMTLQDYLQSSDFHYV
jgi:hypothetical protein